MVAVIGNGCFQELRQSRLHFLVGGDEIWMLVVEMPKPAQNLRCWFIKIAKVLTPQGEATYQAAAQATRARLAERLAALSPGERATIGQAMRTIKAIFGVEMADDADSSTP